MVAVVAAGWGFVRARLQELSRRVSHLERTQDEIVKRCFSNHGETCRTKILKHGAGISTSMIDNRNAEKATDDDEEQQNTENI